MDIEQDVDLQKKFKFPLVSYETIHFPDNIGFISCAK